MDDYSSDLRPRDFSKFLYSRISSCLFKAKQSPQVGTLSNITAAGVGCSNERSRTQQTQKISSKLPSFRPSRTCANIDSFV